jgi:DNA-binding NarL/FixJ family response regulator
VGARFTVGEGLAVFFMTTMTTADRGTPATAGAKSLHILLVDDHADTRDGLRRLLERRGHRVRAAGTCATAQVVAAEMAEDGGLDVVVGDVGLPDGDGVALMQAVVRRHGCRAVALTGWGDPADLRRYAAAGIARAFIKPVDLDAFFKALETLVGV